MACLKTEKQEFLEKLSLLENEKPKDKVSALIVEYGVDDFIKIIARCNKSGLAYHLIRNFGDTLDEGQLAKASDALWYCPGGPICKWPLYACRDAKEVLGENFNRIVTKAIVRKKVELTACLILDCDLSEEQKDSAVEMIGLRALRSQVSWLRRLYKTDKLSECQKQTLKSLRGEEVALAS